MKSPTNPPVHGVVFDFDGTLVQSTSIKAAAFYSIYEQYGQDVANAVLSHHEAHEGLSRYEKFRLYNENFLGLAYSKELLDSQAEKFSLKVVDGVINAPEVIGATDFIKKCKARRLLCAVNSATPTDELKRIITLRGWVSWFDIVLGSPASKYENLCTIISSWGANAGSVLYFGDAEEDRLAAERAGANFVAIGSKTAMSTSYKDFRAYMTETCY